MCYANNNNNNDDDDNIVVHNVSPTLNVWRTTMQYFVVLKCHHEKCHNEIIIMQKGFLYAAFHTTDDDVDVGPLDWAHEKSDRNST